MEATGMLSRICYREEVEAALRTEGLSGISLLGLQDFPGQGTALIGMMNAHLKPKPYDFAKPEAFAAFMRPVLPLGLLERYTFIAGQNAALTVKLVNYGSADVSGRLEIRLMDRNGGEDPLKTVVLQEVFSLNPVTAPPGTLSDLGSFELKTPDLSHPTALTLELRLDGHVNSYPLWIYPKTEPQCPEDVYETRRMDETAWAVLESGGKVFLAPNSDRESMPNSIQGQFSTDFWSVGTFPFQEGGMGQLIDDQHPLFRDFPTSFHTDWQWWPMASARALILPRRMKTIVTELDSFAYLRPMAQLFECHVGAGKLLFSSFGLHNMLRYPEAEALLSSIYRYLGSGEFEPEQELGEEELRYLFS